jgi:hypothetical protein
MFRERPQHCLEKGVMIISTYIVLLNAVTQLSFTHSRRLIPPCKYNMPFHIPFLVKKGKTHNISTWLESPLFISLLK